MPQQCKFCYTVVVVVVAVVVAVVVFARVEKSANELQQ